YFRLHAGRRGAAAAAGGDALPLRGALPIGRRRGRMGREGPGGARSAHGAAGGGPLARPRNGFRPAALQERVQAAAGEPRLGRVADRKSTRLNSSHVKISYAVFCLDKQAVVK